jgi:hypothetical protein
MRRRTDSPAGSRRRGILLPAFGVLLLPVLALGCGKGGDIQPGTGAAGVRLGDERGAVETSLGKAEKESSSGVQTDKGRKEVTYLIYASKGLDVLLEGGKVRSIFLYHEGADDHRQYPGKTPGGVTLASTRTELLSILGEPSARGTGQDADRWFRYDAGLEVTFQPDGSIHHLVVTRPR